MRGIGRTEMVSILNSYPRLVGPLRGTIMAGFLSKSELEALVTGSVQTTDIADGAVVEDKIGALAVTEGKLGALAVTEGKIGAGAVVNAKVGAAAAIALDKMAADLSNVVLGVGPGYKVARGTAVVTGTEVVATGLTTIVAATATLRADPAMTDYWASCTWAGADLTLKVWKPTAAGDVNPLAGSGGIQVDWVAIGT